MKVRKLVVAAALIAASVSVNAAEGVCSPPPRGNPSLCSQFETALYTVVAPGFGQVEQPTRQATMIRLGLIGPDGKSTGWLIAQIDEWNHQWVLAKQNELQAEIDRQADRRAQAFAQLQEQSDRAEASRQQARATAIYQSEQARNRDAAGWENLANQREQRRQTDAIEDQTEALRRIERNSQVGVPYRYRW